jgi:hypothetical protein
MLRESVRSLSSLFFPLSPGPHLTKEERERERGKKKENGRFRVTSVH